MTLIISLERRVLYKDIIGKHSNFTAIKIYDLFFSKYTCNSY